MSAEFNKVLCAVLSAILVLLLSSFIGELLYHPKKTQNNVSYAIEEEIKEQLAVKQDEPRKEKTITLDTIETLLINANLEEGEKFVTKNCSACHSFNLPIKNKVGPSLAKIMNRKIGSIESYKYSNALKNIEERERRFYEMNGSLSDLKNYIIKNAKINGI